MIGAHIVLLRGGCNKLSGRDSEEPLARGVGLAPTLIAHSVPRNNTPMVAPQGLVVVGEWDPADLWGEGERERDLSDAFSFCGDADLEGDLLASSPPSDHFHP